MLIHVFIRYDPRISFLFKHILTARLCCTVNGFIAFFVHPPDTVSHIA